MLCWCQHPCLCLVQPCNVIPSLYVCPQQPLTQVDELQHSLLLALLPADVEDDGNVILEIRSSVGGEWAGGFAADLLDMYRLFAADQGWRFEVCGGREAGGNGGGGWGRRHACLFSIIICRCDLPMFEVCVCLLVRLHLVGYAALSVPYDMHGG